LKSPIERLLTTNLREGKQRSWWLQKRKKRYFEGKKGRPPARKREKKQQRRKVSTEKPKGGGWGRKKASSGKLTGGKGDLSIWQTLGGKLITAEEKRVRGRKQKKSEDPREP